jgi:hypothetical protein
MEENMMTLEDDFMWITSHAFSEMRLMVEGALNLYEDDSGVLCRLAREADELEAMRSLNDIGTCLYEFRRQIKALQEAHYKASTQTQEA